MQHMQSMFNRQIFQITSTVAAFTQLHKRLKKNSGGILNAFPK